MRARTSVLLAGLLAWAAGARAALDYVAYDLTTNEAAPVAAPNVFDAAYHTGNQILFVRDNAVAQDYYIAVFELSQAHAKALWSVTAGNNPALPFSTSASTPGYDFADGRALPANLAWPTAAQWNAYADDPPASNTAQPCNVSRGLPSSINVSGGPIDYDSWWTAREQWVANAHGVYNIYGNVAEYASDTKLFYGGYASSNCRFANLGNTKNGEQANAIAANSGRVFLGARLVYLPPAEQTYTVTVTLNGERVGEPATHKAGDTVTVAPPEPAAWHRRTGLAITPEASGVTGGCDETLTFAMPETNLTLAYVSTEYARPNGVGCTVSPTEPLVGAYVSLKADAPDYWQAFTGWQVEGVDGLTLPDADDTVSVQVGAGWQDTVTFTAIFKDLPRVLVHGGSATVAEGTGEAKGNGYYTPGATLALAPDTPEGRRFQGWRQADGTMLEGDAFTVPAAPEGYGTVTELTAVFAAAPRVLLSGGTATVKDGTGSALGNGAYTPGTVLTLTHAEREGQAFISWTHTGDGTLAGDTFTVGEGDATLAAVYRDLPRVFVCGGTARVTSGEARGNGYYTPGTLLALTEQTVAGHLFQNWQANGEPLGGSTYTVGDYGADTVTLTARYKADETGEGGEPTAGATLHLASQKDDNAFAAYDTLFGTTPNRTPTTLTDAYGNRYQFYDYGDAGAIATFDLATGKLAYAAEDTSGLGEALDDLLGDTLGGILGGLLDLSEYFATDTSVEGKTRNLQLRRVDAADGNDFYMGIFETTIGHIANLEKSVNGSTKLPTDSTNPYCALTMRNYGNYEPTRAQTLFKTLTGRDFRFPTPADVIKVGDANRAENARGGYGADENTGGDPLVKENMVNYGGKESAPKAVGSMRVDPYGFYDLWGNCWEQAGDGGAPFGGAYHETQFRACQTEHRWNNSPQNVAFRPVIDVETPMTLRLALSAGGDETAEFRAVPGARLFPDETEEPVRPGYAFAGWTLGGVAIAATYELTEDDAGKTLAATWTPVTTLVKFVDCSGPEAVVPGLDTTVYTLPGRELTDVTVAPEGFASVRFEAGAETFTLTIAADAEGDATVTAFYADEALTATYAGCTGPKALTPGEAATVTPTGPGTFVGLAIEPAGAADWALAEDGASATFTPVPGLGTATLAVTALYAEAAVTVTYEGCAGATTACPGLTTTLYTDPTRTLEGVAIEPAGAATWDAETGTLTFAADASGTVTVRAVYALPSVKRGWRLMLR